MSESETISETNFATFEYTTVRAIRDRESLYSGAYKNFGWTVEGHEPATPGTNTVTLKLKRNRGIRNRPMVMELQRKCESALTAITSMERSISPTAIAAALTVGIIGSGLLAGSIFALDAGLTFLSILLGTNGIIGWTAGYFAYGRVKARKTAALTPAIDHQYDIVFETGERASELLQPTSHSTNIRAM